VSVAGLLKKLWGRADEPGAPGTSGVPGPAYDAGPGLAAYERLAAAALLLRSLDTEVAAAMESVAEREGRLRASAEEYERLAQAAIAGGRTIQAESAIASAETAQAALDALAPRGGELAAVRQEIASTAARIESEAADLRARIDQRAAYADPAPAARRAEDDAVRLTSLVRSLAT
jgi:acetylornithine deacetylase/succinyl-diaminopimelate desuccinylase-like protein